VSIVAGAQGREGVLMKPKTLYAIFLIFTLLVLSFVVYGITTQCEDVAIYYYCGDGDE